MSATECNARDLARPTRNRVPRPPVKWAGGKGQLLPQFELLFPRRFTVYHEPFFGGGAVFFHLLPERAVLIDINPELMNFYRVLRDRLEELLADARRHKNEAGYYYQVRSMEPEQMDPVARASRFLYLNKTAYNGLWRVNRQGRHNVPFGRYKNPRIVDEKNLRAVSEALKRAEILLDDFGRVLDFARPGDFVYFDPPYYPLSRTANFTDYTAESFGPEDQKRLARVFRELDRRGCLVMLSNSDTTFIRDLYRGYDVRVVYAKRAINCQAEGRRPISELVIRNYS
jgi:DNA adenine methylase